MPKRFLLPIQGGSNYFEPPLKIEIAVDKFIGSFWLKISELVVIISTTSSQSMSQKESINFRNQLSQVLGVAQNNSDPLYIAIYLKFENFGQFSRDFYIVEESQKSRQK